MDLDIPSGFPSIFSRAYHTHLSQHTSDFDPLTSSFSSSPTMSSTLPQFHPLLVRHADHPQRQAAGRTNNSHSNVGNSGNSGSNTGTAGLSFENITPSAEAAVVAMQQVLTNISTAAAEGERSNAEDNLASGSQRTRGVSGAAPSQQVDTSMESSSIQITQQRWEEESAALDGHAAHLCVALLKEEILEYLLPIYEKENKPKDTSTKTQSSTTETGQGTSSQLTVPHSSDQVTPSSPRGSSVDQLRSSLRQVADALAQTVAAVRNTREQLEPATAQSTRTASQEVNDMEEEGEGGEEGDVQFSDDPDPNLVLAYPLPTSSASLSVPHQPQPPLLSAHTLGQTTSLSSLLNPPLDSFQVSEIVAGSSDAPSQQPTTLTTTNLAPSLSVGGSSLSVSSSGAQISAASSSATVSSFSLPSPMYTQATSVVQLPQLSTTTTTSANTTSVASSFDGSQESARVTLERTDPQDPLYTFLSAYVGAPPPPIVSSVESPSSLPLTSTSPNVHHSQSAPLQPVALSSPTTTNLPPPTNSVTSSASSPRLPVFTQIQSPNTETYPRRETDSRDGPAVLPSQPTLDLTIPSSADHTMRTSPSIPPPATTTSTSTAQHSTSLSTASSATSQATDVVSLAENIASQVTSFFQSTSLNSSFPTQSLDQTVSLANSLAQELSRTASQLTPTSSEGVGVTASDSLSIPTTSAPVVGQASPSPSDMLAPLISSLQMPTTRTTDTASSGSDGAEPGEQGTSPSNVPQTEENPIALETGTASVIGGRPWPEVGEIFNQGSSVGGGHLLESVDPSNALDVAPADGTAVTEAQQSDEMEQEEGATIGGGVGGAASSTTTTTTSTSSITTAAAENMPPALQQLPDTIDREVLAALPGHIQQEVLAQHAREQRARQARQEGFSTTISPEFLSALPPNIQEEVITPCTHVCKSCTPCIHLHVYNLYTIYM